MASKKRCSCTCARVIFMSRERINTVTHLHTTGAKTNVIKSAIVQVCGMKSFFTWRENNLKHKSRCSPENDKCRRDGTERQWRKSTLSLPVFGMGQVGDYRM
ncbi:hypothetical protein CDAR_437541 [Caerostris darwini]|uniref:Uncharacterized protein n=1 Tax=Caerostris darwini TaxID=1538125 RepID=A0AAV4NSE7_9ARAC|nr:hypothetical protein CDAR_437541 [Caerostris darwini]